MSDLIDRQAAIEQTEICDFIRDKNYAGGAELLFADDLRKRLKDLPSAHPELNEWCHECKEYDKEHHCCPRWNRVIKTALADAQPDKTYEQGWKDGREALRKEIWEDGRDGLD